MCHLMFYPPNVPCVPGDLAEAAVPNDEGSGFGFALDGTPRVLLVHRSMDSGALIGAFEALRAELPEFPAVFHSRLATTGVVCYGECHPIMTQDGQYAVFLNGTLDMPLEPGRTDTRTFAEDVLRDLDLDHPDNRDYIEQLCRKTNAKLLILTSDPDAKSQWYMFNADQWVRTPYGAWASNRDHLGGPGNGAEHGWDEITDGRENLWRWRNLGPGQCPGCHLYNCNRGCAPSEHPPAWRNETERRERTRA